MKEKSKRIERNVKKETLWSEGAAKHNTSFFLNINFDMKSGGQGGAKETKWQPGRGIGW